MPGESFAISKLSESVSPVSADRLNERGVATSAGGGSVVVLVTSETGPRLPNSSRARSANQYGVLVASPRTRQTCEAPEGSGRGDAASVPLANSAAVNACVA